MPTQPLTTEKAIENWTHFQHLISIGAFEERHAEHYENNTWPEDGVEESVHWLEKWASDQGLTFCWNPTNKTWSLEELDDEEEEEELSEEELERRWCEYHSAYHWPCF